MQHMLIIPIYCRWNKFRSVCNFEKKLGLALEITADVPPEEEVARWMGEPIKCIIMPTTLFMTNKKGYPVLSRSHQALVKQLANLDIQVIVRGASRHTDIKYYQQYLDHFWQVIFIFYSSVQYELFRYSTYSNTQS